MAEPWDGLRIGYVPYDATLRRPGDRRRFPFWARHRGVPFELAEVDQRYDVVVLSARADVTAWASRPADGTLLVYDLIDSYLDLPRRSVGNVLRGSLKFAMRETSRLTLDYHGAMVRLARRADAVVCSTPEQAATIRALNANVHDVLDAHVELAATVKHDWSTGATANLVWEGLPYTLPEFRSIAPVLQALDREHTLALHLLTDLEWRQYGGRFRRRRSAPLAHDILPSTYLYEWNEHLLSAIATACDVAVVPLDLTDALARGKPENKLLLFWRLGLPAVVSATPAYQRVTAAAGGPSLTCASPAEWATTLRRVLADESLRRDAAEAGLAYVERVHAVDAILGRWDDVLASVLT